MPPLELFQQMMFQYDEDFTHDDVDLGDWNVQEHWQKADHEWACHQRVK